MADSGKLVLCGPLCFLVKKYSKSLSEMLKNTLVDFYDPDDISKAKQQLLNDFNLVKERVDTEVIDQHIPVHHEGEDRAQREVDDIFNIMDLLCEKDLLSMLPTYVSDGPDSMPSTRLYDGDLGVLMASFERMENRIAILSSTLTGISRVVYTLQAKILEGGVGVSTQSFNGVNNNGPRSTDVSNTALKSVGRDNPVPRVVTSQRNPGDGPISSQPSSTSLGNPFSQPISEFRSSVVRSLPGVSTATTNTAAVSIDNTVDDTNVPRSLKSNYQWCDVTSTPRPNDINTNNRFSVLSADVDNCETDDDQFVTVQSRREIRQARAAKRQLSSTQQPQPQPTRPRQPVKSIKGTLTGFSANVWAAKKSKAVLCIDNVSLDCNEADIKCHVAGLDVEIFSCHKTKPRRRPGQSVDDVNDRAAFRLCINAKDRSRVMSPDSWPDSVRVSDWFFRSKIQPEVNDKRPRVGSGGQSASVTVASQRNSTEFSSTSRDINDINDNNDDDMDMTIITQYQVPAVVKDSDSVASISKSK